MTFPAKLRQLRAAAALSVAALASKAKLSRAAVYAIEAGKRDPSVETARKLCRALKCSLSEFD